MYLAEAVHTIIPRNLGMKRSQSQNFALAVPAAPAKALSRSPSHHNLSSKPDGGVTTLLMYFSPLLRLLSQPSSRPE